jgi:hypothetical protein
MHSTPFPVLKQFNGAVELTFDPAGLNCTISLPIKGEASSRDPSKGKVNIADQQPGSHISPAKGCLREVLSQYPILPFQSSTHRRLGWDNE